MQTDFRKMTYADIHAVADLLQANAQSQQGGLHGEYPFEKVEAMYQSSTNAIIAIVEQKIIAVVFSFPVTSFSLPPIAQEIQRRFSDITQNNWFYGPVCIDAEYRGKAILAELYHQICLLHAGHSIAFINAENTRSLKAHQKIGMKCTAQFEFNQQSWWLMVG